MISLFPFALSRSPRPFPLAGFGLLLSSARFMSNLEGVVPAPPLSLPYHGFDGTAAGLVSASL